MKRLLCWLGWHKLAPKPWGMKKALWKKEKGKYIPTQICLRCPYEKKLTMKELL